MLHTYIGVIHLASETIFQLHFLARPSYMIAAAPNVIATRMVIGTLVSVLGKARQHRHESLLEKMLVSSVVATNVWMTFLCFTEYTFPVGCGLPFMATLECPWLLPVNAILCSAVTIIATVTMALIALAPNKHRKRIWAMGKTGRRRDRVFAVTYNSLAYFLPTTVYAIGSWNIGSQITCISSWRTLLASTPELVNVFGNTLTNTLYANNIAVFLMTMAKLGLVETSHATLGYALFLSKVTYRALEALTAVTMPTLLSIGIRPFYLPL